MSRARNSHPRDRAASLRPNALGEQHEISGGTEAERDPVRHGRRVLAILGLLMGFASISTDLYLPAMPAISTALDAPEGVMEWTLTSFLIGFCLGQLFWGPISDRRGRWKPAMVGIVLFMIGSAGCAMAGDSLTLIVSRIVQATGAAGAVVLSRAIVGDLYKGHRAAQVMSTLMMIMATAPLLGPIIGGQLLTLAGWRAIFWAQIGIGAVGLIALFALPETLPPARRQQEGLSRALSHYGLLLRHRRILGYGGAGGFFYGGMFAYFAGTPGAYITYHHVPAQLYGVLFGLGIVGLIAANVINARIVPTFGPDRLLMGGTMAAAAAALVIAVMAGTGWGGLWGLIVPLFVYVSSAGFIVANSIIGALRAVPERGGSVSALVGAMQYGFGILGTGLVGAFADGTPWPMGWVIGLAGIGSLLSVRFIASHGSEGRS